MLYEVITIAFAHVVWDKLIHHSIVKSQDQKSKLAFEGIDKLSQVQSKYQLAQSNLLKTVLIFVFQTQVTVFNAFSSVNMVSYNFV